MRMRLILALKHLSLLLIGGLLLATQAFAQTIFDDSDSLVYQPKPQVIGRVFSVGSDTLSPLMSVWGQAFSEIYPNVYVQQQAAGSSSAPTALIEGTASIGPMSRQMTAKEQQDFETQYGYLPLELKVAVDAVGIFVHQDNPIKGLNLQQLDSIFSASMRCGADHKIRYWQELGIEQEWGKLRIEVFGRNSASGTYGFFKRQVLCHGDYDPSVNELAGAASVVQAVASQRHTLGYSGVGNRVSDARLLAVAKEGDDYIEPTRENILSGKYPLSRYLYIYVNQAPDKPLTRVDYEFLSFILSQEGQDIAQKAGYLPLSKSLQLEQKRSLNR